MDDPYNSRVKIHWSGTLPPTIDVVIQRWTFSRLRESFAAHVGQRELSPMLRLRRNHDTSCLKIGHLASNVLAWVVPKRLNKYGALLLSIIH